MEQIAQNAIGAAECVQDFVNLVLEEGDWAMSAITMDADKSQIAAEIVRDRQNQENLVKMLTNNVKCKDEETDADPPIHRQYMKVREDAHKSALMRYAIKLMPILTWLPVVFKDMKIVLADAIAGLTVGVMVIPQSMSYASIAGLPYIYGMYSACVPTAVYAIFGQSRQLAVGPVAMVSLLVEAGLRGQLTEEECPAWFLLSPAEQELQPQYEMCPDPYVRLAFLTSLVVGVMQIVAAFFKLGFLVSFLGHPVISGFTSGAAIIIGLSQLKYVLGYDLPKSQFVYETFFNIIDGIDQTKPATLILGITFLLYLMANKKLAQKKFPGRPELSKRVKMLGPLGPLFCCVVGSLIVIAFPVLHEEYHVKYVGDIPSGLPPISMDFRFGDMPKVISTALTSCLIGYMESVAIGKSLAAKHSYEIDAGQELLALGVANAAGACFSCYPVTGSFSRSAVSNQTGAQTQLAGMITAIMMLMTLLFLTPLFYYLPKFVLSAVVLNSVIALVAVKEAKELCKTSPKDFILWITAFLGTLFVGVLPGILIAVGLSLVIVIYESVRPPVVVLWRIPGTAVYRSMQQENRGKFVPNVLIIRIGASMYFANATFVKDSIINYVEDLQEVNPTEYVIVEMTPVISIDSTAAHVVHDIVSHFRSHGVQVAFAQVGNRVDKMMRRATHDRKKLRSFIGEQWIHPHVASAVQYCLRHQHVKRKMRDDPVCSSGEVKISQEEHAICVEQATEVGFSNEFAADATCVFINLARDVPMIMREITAVFKKDQVTIARAQIEPQENDGAKHTYFLTSNRNGAKLEQWEIERLREELEALLEAARDSTYEYRLLSTGSDARLSTLREALAQERANNATIQSELELQNARIAEYVNMQRAQCAAQPLALGAEETGASVVVSSV